MAWFKGKLYVGTQRAYECALQAAIDNFVPAYPPSDPDIQCTLDVTDLPLQAEIWAWSPSTDTWALVFRSPNDVPILGTSKFTSRDTGFRGLYVFEEPDGTQALYAGGCSAKVVYNAAAGGRILRTTDGVNFEPVPQDAGTFLGNLNKPCFRGAASLNGKFYVVASDFKGQGVVLESANPAAGNNSFRQITPQRSLAYEIASYNGFLYIAFVDSIGFSLFKVDTSGGDPYTFIPIFVRGGYRQTNPHQVALSITNFNGDLFVGSNSVQTFTTVLCAIRIACIPAILGQGGAELFRVHADDTWDLVVGESRSTPAGLKVALSGWGAGFNWPLNQHMWRMEVHDGVLYVGTYDVSTELRNTPGLGPALTPLLGFDLWSSTDGIQFVPVDINGFGDKFNYGVRTLLSTPSGLMLGTANPYYGLQVFRGSTGAR